MLIETRTTIEPADITAIELECRNCGAKSVRKLDAKFRTPPMCGNCSAVWFVVNGPDATDLEDFVRSFRHYSEKQFPFTLKFEIPSDSHE